MRLTRFEPFRVADLLQQNAAVNNNRDQAWQPPTDVLEYADAYVLRLDVPGVAAGDIDITTDRGILSITGERKPLELDGSATLSRQERRSGKFERRFTLADTSDIENIRAQSRDGILEVRIPKVAEVQPRTITVEAA